MFEDLIKIRVADVKVAVPAGNGVEAGMVVLEEEDYPHRSLRMFIGQPEARAIHGPWSNAVPPRPSTWDLFVSTITLLDGRIERVIITDVEELRHFFAQLVLIYQGNEDVPLLVTARPSDALALALRAYGAEIYAEPHVLEVAGVLADGTTWVRPEPEEGEDEEEGVDDEHDDGEDGDEDEGDEDEGEDDESGDDADQPTAGALPASEWGAEALAASGSAADPSPEVGLPVAGQVTQGTPIERAPDGHVEPAWRRRGLPDPNKVVPAVEATDPPAPAGDVALESDTPPAPAGDVALESDTPPAPAGELTPADKEAKRKKVKKTKKVVKKKAEKKKAAGKKRNGAGSHFVD